MEKCQKCGCIVEPNDKFCGSCGAIIKHEVHEIYEAHLSNKDHTEYLQGVIFTDTNALSLKFGISRETIIDTLHKYIQAVQGQIRYRLLDAHEHLQRDTTQSVLMPMRCSNWKDYHKILHQQHSFHSSDDKTLYLFIIGGEDIIPMPEILNEVNALFNIRDQRIPADLPYAFTSIISDDSIGFINGIAGKQVVYHIGRLPLGTDSSFDTLEQYLRNAAANMAEGIPVQIGYAQCDPNWKRVSQKVATDMETQQLIPQIEADPSLCYHNIFLSPYVTCDTIGRAFNPYANLYYFNLHGSDNVDDPCFGGNSTDEEPRRYYHAISPESLKTAKFANIVVTEACYGAKYRMLPTERSMVQTAISHNTLLYVGSSVIVYGQIDPVDPRLQPSISGGDLVAKNFINSLMKGMTAGEALTDIKMALYNSKKTSDLLAMIEFSLYGDPRLTASFTDSDRNSRQHETYSQATYKTTIEPLSSETIYEEGKSSLLSMVRQRVDKQFEAVQQEIESQLATFGVKPRKLLSIKKIRRGMSFSVSYVYEVETGEKVLIEVDHDNERSFLFPKNLSIDERLQAAQQLCIDYEGIFRQMNRFFTLSEDHPDMNGLDSDDSTISLNIPMNMADRGGHFLLDKRIESQSKLQVRTFNALLEESYRKRMANSDVQGLAVKDKYQEVDFAALINPLNIIIETELRSTIGKYLKRIGKYDVDESEQTYGSLTSAMWGNLEIMQDLGIKAYYIKKIDDNKQTRNDSSHKGDISEGTFLDYYQRFIDIIEDKSFSKLMEIKKINRKQK